MSRKPRKELAPDGPDNRRPGRGNKNAVVHGAYSRSLSAASARADIRATTLADLGTTEADVTRPMSAVIDLFVGAQLIANSYFEFLASQPGFAITTKGRQRRAVDGYLKAADRCVKFAVLLGLERRTRHVPISARAWLESLPNRPAYLADSLTESSNHESENE